MEWIFKLEQIKEAVPFYHQNGYVGFSDILSENDLLKLKNGFDDAVRNGAIELNDDAMIGTNDAMLRSPEFEALTTHPGILTAVKAILNQENGLEIQHSKLNNKPLKDKGAGFIEWHQDYPFFPHTNFDLIAVGIHFDDENEQSGSLKVIPGSHKLGVLSHCDADQVFAYHCTEMEHADQDAAVLLTCPAGTVTIHHCLTLHQSAAKSNNRQRRLLVLQYRTDDNLQLGGVLWKCTGHPVTPPSSRKGFVRFPDGTLVENRGKEGRLFDKYGKLAPSIKEGY